MSSSSNKDGKDEKDSEDTQKNPNDVKDEKNPEDAKKSSESNDEKGSKNAKKNTNTNESKDAKERESRAVSIYSLESLKEELSSFRTRESINSGQTQESYPGIYRSEYDYTAERHNPFATNLPEAISYLIKGCLGAGVLSMHEGFMYGGMVGSGIGAAAIGLLLSHCKTILVRSAQRMYVMIHVPRLSYPDLAEAAVATGPLKKLRKYSKNVRYFLELVLFLETSGSCSIYEIVIARTIKKELEYLSAPIRELHLPLRSYLFIIMIPLIILCMIRKWKYLAPFSMVADLFVAICVITTMVYSMSEAESIEKRSLWKSVPGLFKFFGICLYTMDGTPVVLPIENNMRSPHHVEFVIYTGMTVVVILSALAGFLGYWGWGEQSKSPVTIHMPLETVPIILQFLLVAMLAVTFAIHFWVPFKIIWHYLGTHRSEDLEKRYSLERFYRALLLFFITCVSLVFPQHNRLMIFLGVTLICINSLFFPTLIETLVFWHDHNHGKIRWYVIKNVIIAILGAIFCVGGLYTLYIA